MGKKGCLYAIIYPIQIQLQEKEKRHPIPENRNKAQAVAFSHSVCRIMVPGVKECILDARIKRVKGESRGRHHGLRHHHLLQK